MKKLIIAGLSFALFMAITALYYVFQPAGNAAISLTSIIPPLTAFLCGIYAFRYHGLKSAYGKAIFFFSLLALFGTVGTTFLVLYNSFGVEQLLVPAILIWQGPYVLTFLSLYFVWKTTSHTLTERKILALKASLIFISYFIILLSVPSVMAATSQNQLIFTMVSAAQGIQILVSVAFVTISLYGGRLMSAWKFIFLSFFLLMTGGTINGVMVSYRTSGFIELFFGSSAFLLAFGFLYNRHIFEEAVAHGKAARSVRR